MLWHVSGPSGCGEFDAFLDGHGICSFHSPLCRGVAIVDDAGFSARELRALRFVCHLWPKVKSRDLYCVRVYRSAWCFCLSVVSETAARGARSIGFITKEGGPLRRLRLRRKPDVRREWIQITVWLKMGLGWHAFICHLDGRCCLCYIWVKIREINNG